MKKLLFHLNIHKYQLILLYIGALMLTLLTIIQPRLFSLFIDSIVKQFEYNLILKLIFLIMILNLIYIFLRYTIGIYEKRILNKITFSYITDIITHVQKIPYSKYIELNAMYTAQRIKEDSSQIISFCVNHLSMIIIHAFQIIVIILFLINISNHFIYIITIFIFLYFILYYFIKLPLYKSYYDLRNSSDSFKESLILQFTNMKFIRLKSLYSKSIHILDKKFDTLNNSSIKYVKISHLFNSIDSIITGLFNIVIMFIFGRKAYFGDITIGEFTIIQVYFSIVVNTLKYFISFFKSIQEFKVSFNRINELINIPLECNGKKDLDKIQTITLNNINFGYKNSINNSKNIIFNDFTFKLNKNSIYLIKGKNGSGKSTLLDIVVGLYSSEVTGSIKYNDLDLRDLNIYKIRNRLIGYVEQTIYCGDETVFEYLYDNPVNEDNEIQSDINTKILNELRKLNIESFYKHLTSILYKKMSELSGGQLQKINILREIIKKPEIIFFDEPNSSLDEESVIELRDILLQLKSNTILVIVAHDKSFDDIADYCLNL